MPGILSPLTLVGSNLIIIGTLTLGTSNGMILDAGSDCLKVLVAGTYALSYGITCKDNVNSNNGFHAIACKNDSSANTIAGTDARAYAVTQNRAISISGRGAVALAVNDTLGIYLENTTTSAHDKLVEGFAMTLIKVG